MKNHLPGILITILVTFLFSACAVTSVRSQVDPQFAGRVYHKLLVFVNFSDLGLRQDTERLFRTTLAANGVDAVPATDILFPGRIYSAQEIQKILAEANIEAVLFVAAAGAGTKDVWIPQTSTTQAYVTGGANTAYGQSTTHTYGGHYIGKPWAQFDAALHDLNSGAVVWIARMSSRGNAFADWGDLARSMAKKTSAQLLKDCMVQ